jgi:hypothetical protein
MAFTVKPFRELVAMTKEKLDEAMVPLRVRAAKAKAESEIIKIEEGLLKTEQEIHTLCSSKDIDFNKIGDLMDEYDLAERRLKQIKALVEQLFPET